MVCTSSPHVTDFLTAKRAVPAAQGSYADVVASWQDLQRNTLNAMVNECGSGRMAVYLTKVVTLAVAASWGQSITLQAMSATVLVKGNAVGLP